MPQPKKKLGTKSGVVGEIQGLLEGSQGVFLTEYRGLSVPQINDLRKKLRDAGDNDFSVVKNTLFRRAAEGVLTIDPELDATLNGPTAAVFAKDPLAAAKALSDFLIANPRTPLKVKGGVVEGRYQSAEQIDALAKIPPRDVLIAMLLGAMQSPIANFAATLKSIADKQAEA